MRRRTRARETAMQFLYQLDLRGETLWDELETYLEDAAAEGLLRDADSREFAGRLIRGTWQHRAELDRLITQVAKNWQIDRMATVDRNVLRMATFELLHCREIPAKVVLNEAIEIGKRFSTANSGSFVNGILDRIRIDYVGGAQREPGSSSAKPAATPAGNPAGNTSDLSSTGPVTAEQALEMTPPASESARPLPPPPSTTSATPVALPDDTSS